VGAIGWFFAGKILKCNVPPKGQLKVMNRLIPVIRSIESRYQPPFGVSLLTVAIKQ
jgi:hypothetical protein